MDGIKRLIDEYKVLRKPWLNIGTPWLTLSAQQWLDLNLRPSDIVMEYGIGHSTIFFVKKTRKVVTAEGSPSRSISRKETDNVVSIN